MTPLGDSATAVLSRVLRGDHAFAAPSTFDASPFPCQRASEIRDLQPATLVPEEKTLRLMNRDAVLAVAAARRAMADADLRAGGNCAAERFALYGATGMAGLPLAEVLPMVRHSTRPDGTFDPQLFGSVAMKKVRPVLSFRILANMPICFVSIFENLQGPNAVYSPWEGQGAAAVMAGARAVARGHADCALVGGCDVKTHELAFIALGQQGAFDAWRRDGSGSIPAEGAAFVVLENEAHAMQRGAKTYGRLAGFATRSGCVDEPLCASLLTRVPRDSVSRVVAAGDGDRAIRNAERAALIAAGLADAEIIPPKVSLGNLFAAAAGAQVAVAAAALSGRPAGERVLANCLGHGSEQAAFVLEAV